MSTDKPVLSPEERKRREDEARKKANEDLVRRLGLRRGTPPKKRTR